MEIKREKLIEILSIVKPGIASKAIVDQATHFIFTGEQILTYDDRICICFPFETDFKGSVPGDEFYKIINGMTGETISLSLDKGKLKFKCGNLRASLSMSPEDDIMAMVKVLNVPSLDSKQWKNLPEGFAEGLFFCMFSASKGGGQGKAFLNTLGVKEDAIVSSDSLRITRYFMKSPVEDSFLLPLSSVVEIVKLGKLSGYIAGSSWIHFKAESGVIFSSRVVAEEYPDVHSFFDFDSKEIILPDDFKKSIDAVAILAPGENEIDKTVDVVIENKTIKCRGEKEVGWIESDQKINYDGPKISFLINPTFLIQILDKTKTMGYAEGKAVFVSDSFDHLVSLIV